LRISFAKFDQQRDGNNLHSSRAASERSDGDPEGSVGSGLNKVCECNDYGSCALCFAFYQFGYRSSRSSVDDQRNGEQRSNRRQHELDVTAEWHRMFAGLWDDRYRQRGSDNLHGAG
jgi:hypothetical protein